MSKLNCRIGKVYKRPAIDPDEWVPWKGPDGYTYHFKKWPFAESNILYKDKATFNPVKK